MRMNSEIPRNYCKDEEEYLVTQNNEKWWFSDLES